MVVLEPGETIKIQTDARYTSLPGVLTVTNRRVVFSRRTSAFNRRPRTIVTIPLAAVREVTESTQGPETVLAVTARASEVAGPSRVEFSVSNAVHVARAIRSLVEEVQRPAASPSPSTVPPVHVSVNVPPAAPAPPIILVRCSYCRTVFPELDAKCPSCGAPF